MAILHHKETKIQAVLGRLPKTYTHEQFVEMFINLFSKDWGKIKSAYIKQSQDREAGSVINMPKPDLYLKQLLEIYLDANSRPTKAISTNTTKLAENTLEASSPELRIAKKKPVKTKAKATEHFDENLPVKFKDDGQNSIEKETKPTRKVKTGTVKQVDTAKTNDSSK